NCHISRVRPRSGTREPTFWILTSLLFELFQLHASQVSLPPSFTTDFFRFPGTGCSSWIFSLLVARVAHSHLFLSFSVCCLDPFEFSTSLGNPAMSRIHFDRAYQLSGDDSSSIILATRPARRAGPRIRPQCPPGFFSRTPIDRPFDFHHSSLRHSPIEHTRRDPQPRRHGHGDTEPYRNFSRSRDFPRRSPNSSVVLRILLRRRSRATADVADDEEIELGSVPKRRAGRAGAMPSGR
ncbi:unnamed protein product, partial [Mycena citricolor]